MIILWLLTGITGGLLGAWAGAENTEKNWRRIGAPVLSVIWGILVYWHVWPVLLMSRVGVLSMGYGVPEPGIDDGSAIGAFWFKVFKGNHEKTRLFVRLTIGVSETFSIIWIPLFTGIWGLYIICSVLITGNNILWGAIVPKEGNFKLFGKKCLWEEALIHGINTLIIVGMIILWKFQNGSN